MTAGKSDVRWEFKNARITGTKQYGLYARHRTPEQMEVREEASMPPRVRDFCRAPDPEWEYPCRDIFIEEIDRESLGPWCACETCAMLISMDEREALARRAEVMTGLPEVMNG